MNVPLVARVAGRRKMQEKLPKDKIQFIKCVAV
jgi:hypothetical protein